MNFNVLMENYQRVKELTEESANSAGTADQKYEAYMDSMAAATKRLENAWESFTMKLESSKVLRLTSQAIAGIVENMDKLLPMVFTLLTAMQSSNILKFFTGGEGGFASGGLGKIIGAVTGNRSITMNGNGELAQTQTFRGRVTSSLDEIKKSLYKIAYGTEPGVGEDGTVTFSRMAHRKEWRKYSRNRKRPMEARDSYEPINEDLERQHAAYVSDFKQRAASAGLAAGVGAMTRLTEARQVGGSGLAALVNKTGQTIEESAGDKALGVGLKAGLGIIGGMTPLGPLGSMLGQIIGDNVADLISFGIHRSELEHKQRIAQAKENIEKLSDIKSSVDTAGEEILKSNEDIDFGKLEEYISNLSYTISNYSGDVADIVDSVQKSGVELEDSIENLYKQLRSEFEEVRQQAYYATQSALAHQTYENLKIANEDDKNAVSTSIKSGVRKTGIADAISGYAEANRVIKQINKTLTQKESASEAIRYLRDYLTENTDYREGGITADITNNRNTLIWRAINEKIEELQKYTGTQSSAENDENKAAIEDAFKRTIGTKNGYSRYLNQFTNYELQSMGPEEIYRLVARNLEAIGAKGVRDSKTGEITDEWKNRMQSYIQENYSAALSWDQRKLSQLEKSRKELNVILKQLEIDDDLQKAEEKLRNLYKTGEIDKNENKGIIGGYDETFIGGLLSATDPQRMKDFYAAWGYTEKTFADIDEHTRSILENLSEAQATLTPEGVTEYYKGFSSVLSDITESLSLSKDSLLNIINSYPQLLKYFNQEGNYLEITAELYKTLMDEQNLVYQNAIKNAYMSSQPMFGDFKNENLNAEQQAILDKNNVGSFNALIEAAAKGYITEDIIEAAKSYLNRDLTYKVDDQFLSSAMEYENKIIDKQISSLEEQKKALEDVNNVREKELELIKAKQKLEDAKANKQKVYREGVGFVYETNQDAVSQAQEDIEKLEAQKEAENIQREIDQLNLAKKILSNISEEKEMTKLKNSFDALQKAIGTSGTNGTGLSAEISKLNQAYTNGTATVNLGEEFFEEMKKLINSGTNTGDGSTSNNNPIAYFRDLISKNNIKSIQDFNDYLEQNNLSEKFNNLPVQIKGNITSGLDTSKSTQQSNKISPGHVGHYSSEHNVYTVNEVDYKGEDFYFLGTDKVRDMDTISGLNYNGKNNGDLVWYDGILYVRANGEWYKVSGNSKGINQILSNNPNWASKYASGSFSLLSDQSAIINEVGTEAIITPEGTITSLPSKTGIIPADITKNLWALGEVAPNLVARLGSLSVPKTNSNIGNTTYEEGQYIDSLTMNVYPTKDYDMDRLLAEARSKVKLTKHNH